MELLSCNIIPGAKNLLMRPISSIDENQKENMILMKWNDAIAIKK